MAPSKSEKGPAGPTQKMSSINSPAGRPNQQTGSVGNSRYQNPHVQNRTGSQTTQQTRSGAGARLRNSQLNSTPGSAASPRYRIPHPQNRAGTPSNHQGKPNVGPGPRYHTSRAQNKPSVLSNQQVGVGLSPRHRSPHTQNEVTGQWNQPSGRAVVRQQYPPGTACRQPTPNSSKSAYLPRTPAGVYNPGHSGTPYAQQTTPKGRPDYVKFFGSDTASGGYPSDDDGGAVAPVASPQYYESKPSAAMPPQPASPVGPAQPLRQNGVPPSGELYIPPMHAPYPMPGPPGAAELLYSYHHTGQLPPGGISAMQPGHYGALYGSAVSPNASLHLSFMAPQEPAYPIPGTIALDSQAPTHDTAFDPSSSQPTEFARPYIARMHYMPQNPGVQQTLDAPYQPEQFNSPARPGGLHMAALANAQYIYPATTESSQWQTSTPATNPGMVLANPLHQQSSYETFVVPRAANSTWPMNIESGLLNQPDRFGPPQNEPNSEATVLRPAHSLTAGSQSPIPASYPHSPNIYHGGSAPSSPFSHMQITSAQDTGYTVIATETPRCSPTHFRPAFDHPANKQFSGPAGDSKLKANKTVSPRPQISTPLVKTRR
ncbi:hypothetical protein BIW11_07286 [Tropilaelaps mercedesae]|uniref:Uncharacterized protein n=1 Tax=Tropilaelaps mercedesae TaxID=418985 RepID=A0A1V9XUI7_9ACAR|nr:hypothetical protein BIW11_07286 [Tropilaelaps mercedesae]